MKENKYYHFGLLYLYPIVAFAILGFVVISHDFSYYRELLAFTSIVGLSYVLSYLITWKKIRNLYLIISAVFVGFFAFVKLSFFVNFGSKINASSFYVVFETNRSELSEFLVTYFSFKVILIFLLFSVPVVLLIYALKNKIPISKDVLFFNEKNGIWGKVMSIGFSVIFLCLMYFKGKEESVFMNIGKYYSDYSKTKEILKRELSNENSDHISNVSSKDLDQVHVVVIGESTTKWHLELYGYPRETNPRLSAIKDELMVFDNVVTPNTITIQALDKVLTLSDYQNPYMKTNASVVQLANEAGFETYWISNQKPIGSSETIPTLIGSASDHKYFVSTDFSSYHIHDGDLLPVLDAVIAKEPRKKMIFMHLMGTHNLYRRRYPETYNHFKDPSWAIEKGSRANQYINEYDNAVRYNDYVISEVIRKIKAIETNSFVTYFSDHGDEVYDTEDFIGHDAINTTQPMYDIPFIVWTSDQYRVNMGADHCQGECVNRTYLMEDYFYSFADLADIEFSENDKSRSIFGTEYLQRDRILANGNDYDSLYIKYEFK